MRWIRKNKFDVAAFVLTAAMLALLAGFLVPALGTIAEAVIGAQGNLGTGSSAHRHNFSSTSSGVQSSNVNRICIFCHTPHRAFQNAAILNAPLWNHEMSSTSSYTVNSSGDVFSNATVGNLTLLTSPPSLPDGASRLCLSCHDGTVSIGAIYSRYPTDADITMATTCYDSSGSETAGLTSGKLTSACAAYIGTDLTTKHVVSIPMNSDLITASAANCTSPGISDTKLQYPWNDTNGQNTVLLRPVGSDKTYNSNPGITESTIPVTETKYKSGYNYGVQCSTCHDPHYWIADTGTTGVWDNAGEKMLVLPFNQLCAVCHISC